MSSQNKVLFRCSRLGELMTDPKLKSETLSQTAKTFVRSMWLKREFGYQESFMTDEVMKGLLEEQTSLGLVKQVIGGEFRKKNDQYFHNDFVCGTPDVILKKEDYVEDVKTSFNLRTFTEADLAKNYWWQGQGYMWLTGKTKYRLIYTLVPTPESIIDGEKRRWFYKFGQDEYNTHYTEACAQIERNNALIEEIPLHSRIKVFEFDFEPEKIEALKLRVESAREFYNTLALPYYVHEKQI